MATVNPILFLFWNHFCITRIFCTETLDEEKLLTMEQEHPVLVESKFFFQFLKKVTIHCLIVSENLVYGTMNRNFQII